MAIPRNLSNLAQGADTSGVLGTSKGGTGLTTVGTNGQVLQSNGSALVFATPSAGAMVLISTQNFTNQANPTLTTGISSSYKKYKFLAEFYSSDASNISADFRFCANGVPDDNGAYNTRFYNTNTNAYQNSFGSSRVVLSVGNYGSSIINAYGLDITIFAQYSQSDPFGAKVTFHGVAGSVALLHGSGQYTGTNGLNSAITGIQIFTFGSNVTGTMSLYGISS